MLIDSALGTNKRGAKRIDIAFIIKLQIQAKYPQSLIVVQVLDDCDSLNFGHRLIYTDIAEIKK